MLQAFHTTDVIKNKFLAFLSWFFLINLDIKTMLQWRNETRVHKVIGSLLLRIHQRSSCLWTTVFSSNVKKIKLQVPCKHLQCTFNLIFYAPNTYLGVLPTSCVPFLSKNLMWYNNFENIVVFRAKVYGKQLFSEATRK